MFCFYLEEAFRLVQLRMGNTDYNVIDDMDVGVPSRFGILVAVSNRPATIPRLACITTYTQVGGLGLFQAYGIASKEIRYWITVDNAANPVPQPTPPPPRGEAPRGAKHKNHFPCFSRLRVAGAEGGDR